jgi:hypothetical protein
LRHRVGFTIVKNATILQYPLVESILSILPIVDEYVVWSGSPMTTRSGA